jgi:hypothetical protein
MILSPKYFANLKTIQAIFVLLQKHNYFAARKVSWHFSHMDHYKLAKLGSYGLKYEHILFLQMCPRVLKGIQSHLKRLDLSKSLYPSVHIFLL